MEDGKNDMWVMWIFLFIFHQWMLQEKYKGNFPFLRMSLQDFHDGPLPSQQEFQ